MLTICVAALAAFSVQGGQYTITQIKPLPGYRSFTPLYLNDKGTVVGINSGNEENKISLWRAGVHEALPGIGNQTTVKGLNNNNVVALNIWDQAGNKAVLYENGQASSLPLVGDDVANIIDLNDRGDVLVSAGNASLVWTGRRYQIIDKSGQTFPSAINNSGLVCGVTRRFIRTKLLGFTWKNNRFAPMGESKGIGSGLAVLCLNDRDQILVEHAERSFRWQNGSYQLLCQAPNQAWRFNKIGQTIGHSGPSGPFIIQDDQVVLLASLLINGTGWQLQYVTAINDDGWIIGTGFWFGQLQGFVLKANS